MSVLTGLEPAASRLPVEVPVSCNAALRSGDGTRTHGLLGMNQTICQLIYPAALPVFPGCQQLQRHLSYLRFSGGQTDNKRNRPYILLLCQLSYLLNGQEDRNRTCGTKSPIEVSDLCSTVRMNNILHLVVVVNTKMVKILDYIFASLYNSSVSEGRRNRWIR